MKYLSNWQPLLNEDRHTALVFGFMRHAPTSAALNPWLSDVLGRPVKAAPLGQGAFWPTLPSMVPGSVRTEPELVFEADDGESLTVVIEVKPGYDMLQLPQIAREVVDAAAARRAHRVACVMVGADLNPPMKLTEWREEVARSLSEHLPETMVEAELAYASFASLGRAAQDCAAVAPEWSPYADDLRAQLQRKGVLGYEGAPMLDDLDTLSVPTAVEAFNRSIRAARNFLLQLHGQPGFAALDLTPFAKNAHRLYRNGGSTTLTAQVEWFETTVAMSMYRGEGWDPHRVVFICFDLLGSNGTHADLCVGACEVTAEFTYGWARAESVDTLSHPVLKMPSATLTETKSGVDGDWRFARRPWVPGKANEDIAWVIARLGDAIGIWTSDAAMFRGGHSDLALVSTETIRRWLTWWSDPNRTPEGQAEAGRNPVDEIAKLQEELEARESG